MHNINNTTLPTTVYCNYNNIVTSSIRSHKFKFQKKYNNYTSEWSININYKNNWDDHMTSRLCTIGKTRDIYIVEYVIKPDMHA